MPLFYRSIFTYIVQRFRTPQVGAAEHIYVK